MKTTASMIVLLLAAVLMSGHAWAKSANVTDPDAPRSLPAEGTVSVQWSDPAQFSEIRFSGNRWESVRGDWVRDIARYIRKRAANQLPQGQRLDVTIRDIKRAGDYEPGRGIPGSSIRYMRDLYPPRIDLEFTLLDGNGQVLAQGTRKLTDLGYLRRSSRVTDTDPLRYEKQLIDDWLRKDLKKNFKDDASPARA